MVARTGPEMEQEQDTTTWGSVWYVVSTGFVVVFHASQSTPQPPCLSLLCTHLLRVPGGEEGAGPQLADDLVAELGAGMAAVIGEAWVPELETKVAEDYVKFYNH